MTIPVFTVKTISFNANKQAQVVLDPTGSITEPSQLDAGAPSTTDNTYRYDFSQVAALSSWWCAHADQWQYFITLDFSNSHFSTQSIGLTPPPVGKSGMSLTELFAQSGVKIVNLLLTNVQFDSSFDSVNGSTDLQKNVSYGLKHLLNACPTLTSVNLSNVKLGVNVKADPPIPGVSLSSESQTYLREHCTYVKDWAF